MKTIHSTARAYGKGALTMLAMVIGTAFMMAACSSVKPPPKMFGQGMLPDMIRVPAGNDVLLETTAVGVLNYECRANAPTAGMIGWTLASPKADLLDRTGKTVASYSGPPATWAHIDGSSVVGSQLAVAPVLGATNLPMQLSKGTTGAGAGMLQNVSYIQRIKTKGGLDFSKPCTQAEIGDKMTLPYQADYIFWKAV
jgi:Protein of unknown function (DUF3455)